MTYQPPQDPWSGQASPPPPPWEAPAGQFGGTPPYPTAQFPAAQPDRRSWWQRLSGGAKVALVAAGVLVLCCCGGVAIAAVTDPPATTDKQKAAPATSAPGADAPAQGVAGPASPSAETATTEASPSASPSPVVEIRTVTETEKISYETRTVKDSSLAEGTKKVRTRGVPGVRTLTYEVTITDGAQTSKKLVKSVVTKAPVAQVVAVGTKQTRQCDPNYSGACVPVASDVDCAGGSGNGPAYVRGPVYVVGEDIYDLDRDGDGVGCDT